MSKKRAKILLILTLAVLVFGAIFYFYKYSKIKADSDLGFLKSEKNFDLVLDEKNIKFAIKSYKNDEITTSYLFFSNVFKIKRVQLVGFEDDINLCGNPVIKLGGKDAICLVGDVGAHSQNIALVNNGISLVEILEENSNLKNVITDSPNYFFLDYNEDSELDLIIDNRDYEKDPLVNAIRKYYRWAGSGFVFDKVEDIAVK